MAYEGKYQAMPVEDIRSSSITYEQLIMRSFDRLDAMIGTAAKEELYSLIEDKIRYDDSMLYPYWKDDEVYKENRLDIISKLSNVGRDTPAQYRLLTRWIRLLTTRFSKMNILPERKMAVIAGIGELAENKELLK